ncbi:MAG TPA: extensin family protein [Sandaracinaceae bacterium LLY-WYZ-13_1]|nr:extensin family protein [Sandaracinaceae bacterium LLY-WYZ-13_1]
MGRRACLGFAVALAALAGCGWLPDAGRGEVSRGEPSSAEVPDPSSDEASPLDERSRRVPAEGELECPDVELVWHRGDEVAYRGGGVRITPSFRDELEALERIAAEVGERVLGRPPESIRHLGTYNCRRVRGRPHRLSEHAFGNGIDVAGFRFGPAPREARDELPRSLWWRTTVSVREDWTVEDEAKDEARVLRRRFLHELTDELAARGVFRAMLGPAHPRHENHFHFDHGPWSYRIL